MLQSIEAMNNLLESYGYQIVSSGEGDPVVLSKLPGEDLALNRLDKDDAKSDNDKDNDKDHTKETITPNEEKTADDLIFQLYVGSLTVVGLFILFRMIQKSQ